MIAWYQSILYPRSPSWYGWVHYKCRLSAEDACVQCLLWETRRGTSKCETPLYPVHVVRPTSLNFSQEVTTTDSLDGISDQDQTCFANQWLSEATLGCGMPDHSLWELCFKCSKFPTCPALWGMKWSQFILTFLTWCIASIARDVGIHNSGASSLVYGSCNKNGEAPYLNPPHCIDCTRAHSTNDRRFPFYLVPSR